MGPFAQEADRIDHLLSKQSGLQGRQWPKKLSQSATVDSDAPLPKLTRRRRITGRADSVLNLLPSQKFLKQRLTFRLG
jgi:hypothetical protein